jgi:hypothetical protein
MDAFNRYLQDVVGLRWRTQLLVAGFMTLFAACLIWVVRYSWWRTFAEAGPSA